MALKIKALAVDAANNPNIEYVERYLQEKGEPYILLFQNNKGDLAMVAHKTGTEAIKVMLHTALVGLVEGIKQKLNS